MIDELYRQEYQPMVRLARLMIGSLTSAEEVVHDAFLSVHDRLAHIDNPGAYLRRTVINNSYDVLRRRSLEDRKLPMVASNDVPVLPAELDETWQALDCLSPKQRAALILRYYEDRSIRDVAELMQEKEGTVKSLIHRGLGQLRKELDR